MTWFKTFFAFFFIILDVAVFPFSCSNRKNEYAFVISISDKEHSVNYHERFFDDIPKNRTIEFPESWNYTLVEGYELVGWYIYDPSFASKEEQETEKVFVEFPYQIQDEDRIGYFEGHRNCVVFMAEWKYVGNASA